MVGHKDLYISTFAAGKSRKQTCEVVKVVMETKEGDDLLLMLLTTPVICEPITCGAVKGSILNYEHLQGLELAETAREGELIEFDVLINLDRI